MPQVEETLANRNFEGWPKTRKERPEYWRAGWLTARLIEPSVDGLSIGGRGEVAKAA